MKKKARVIAFYLPQYHPTPENDLWWGKGFTEWTNVGKAKPLFRGHYQPRVPADLGYYDLRMPEIREMQAQMAKEAGIEGFCYWHYWLGNGKRMLERPFNEVLKSGTPDLPFCLGWANHSWSTKTWKNASKWSKNGMIAEQQYLGEEDHKMHFYSLLDAFRDERYIRVDGKPLFLIVYPLRIPNVRDFISLWRRLAEENGLKGIHFVGITETATNFDVDENLNRTPHIPKMNETDWCCDKILNLGFDAVNSRGTWRAEYILKGRFLKIFHMVLIRCLGGNIPDTYNYRDLIKYLYTTTDSRENVYPTLIPQFDRSPRGGREAVIYTNSTPELFKKSIETVLPLVENKEDEHKIIFLQSWNEWGEGNYVEPDIVYGHGYLDALKKCLIIE